MHFSRLFTLPLVLGLTLATAVPDRVALSPDKVLERRTCASLSPAKCHAKSGARGGVYCGYCAEVLGTDWAISGHNQ